MSTTFASATDTADQKAKLQLVAEIAEEVWGNRVAVT